MERQRKGREGVGDGTASGRGKEQGLTNDEVRLTPLIITEHFHINNDAEQLGVFRVHVALSVTFFLLIGLSRFR